jgi:glycerophosphoryl diester phosphodiesterase
MNRMIALLLAAIGTTMALSFARGTRNPQVVQPPALPAVRHTPIVIAHRADHEHAPENTIAAIDDAIRCGADYVELDLRTTRDGHLILNHDATVDRMTGSHGVISDLPFAEIESLVVRNPGATPKGNHMPEFRDALRACEGKINIYLDFKEADVAETWRQIRAAHLEHQVVVYLNKPGQYEQWRAIAPQVPLMTSLPDEAKTPAQITAFLQEKKIRVLDNVYDTTLQDFVRQKGVDLWLDGQSDKEGPASWQSLLAGHIQGIQTDHPSALIAWLAHRNHAATAFTHAP